MLITAYQLPTSFVTVEWPLQFTLESEVNIMYPCKSVSNLSFIFIYIILKYFQSHFVVNTICNC